MTTNRLRQVEASEAVVSHGEAGADSVGVAADGVAIAEEGGIVDAVVDEVGVADVVEDEVVPIQFSSRTDIRACSLQKAKTTCW